MYLIEDTPANRRQIGKYIEVFQFPDGRLEIRVAGLSLPYSTYNKVGTIDHSDIVDKRLSQVLRTAQIVQARRDDRFTSTYSGSSTGQERYFRRTKFSDFERFL